MTDATIGYGTTIAFDSGASPVVFTTVAEVFNISGPGFNVDVVDATHMQSPGGWEEVLAGIKRSGEITLECNHLPANATQNASTGVLSLFNGKIRRDWRLTFPTSPPVMWEFEALITAFEPGTPVEDKMTLSITLKPTGEPAFL